MRTSSGVSQLRKAGKAGQAMLLRVPPTVADRVRHLDGTSFICELTDDGFLFRPVGSTSEQNEEDLPAWAQQ